MEEDREAAIRASARRITEAHGLPSVVVVMTKYEAEIRAIGGNLERAGDYVIVNYRRIGRLQQGGAQHFTAWCIDADSDSVSSWT